MAAATVPLITREPVVGEPNGTSKMVFRRIPAPFQERFLGLGVCNIHPQSGRTIVRAVDAEVLKVY